MDITFNDILNISGFTDKYKSDRETFIWNNVQVQSFIDEPVKGKYTNVLFLELKDDENYDVNENTSLKKQLTGYLTNTLFVYVVQNDSNDRYLAFSKEKYVDIEDSFFTIIDEYIYKIKLGNYVTKNI
jgi:hypothetical protein